MPNGNIETSERSGASDCSWCSDKELPQLVRKVCDRCRDLLLDAGLAPEEIYGPASGPEDLPDTPGEQPKATSKCCGAGS